MIFSGARAGQQVPDGGARICPVYPRERCYYWNNTAASALRATAVSLMSCFTAAAGQLHSIVYYEQLLYNVNSNSDVDVRYLLSPVRLSSVTFVRPIQVHGSNFRQCFYGIRYLGHSLTFTENFTEVVPGEPLRRGS